MTKRTIALALASAYFATAAVADIKIGYIGSMTSDAGLSTLRGTEIAIDEINNGGGLLGQSVSLVTAETNENEEEGRSAYRYLAEIEQVDFIMSGSVDSVSLAWADLVPEYGIPTLDTWTSSVAMIDLVVENPEQMKPYFMNMANDDVYAALSIDFGRDVLKAKQGWDTVYILAEETAFGDALIGLVRDTVGPAVGIEVLGVTSYDVGTLDFRPIFNEAVNSGADFLYVVSSVNSNVIASQYAELQVPMGMTGVIVATFGAEFWEDTGGRGEGISSLAPIPAIGFQLDPISQAFLDTYQSKFDGRPAVPHFNGFNAYYGLKQAMAAAEEVGGFELDQWVPAMEKQDTRLSLNGEPWLRYAFWGTDEIEPRSGRTYPHNIRFDMTPPFADGSPPMVVTQWTADGQSVVIYPEKYATGEFTLPSWISN